MEECGQRPHLVLDNNSCPPNSIIPVERFQQTDNSETVQPASLGSQSENTDSVNTVFDKRILNRQNNCSELSSVKHRSDDPYVGQPGMSRDGASSGGKEPNFIVGGLINSRTVKGQKMQVAVNDKFADYKILLDSEPGPSSFDEHCHDLMSRECHDIMTKECHIPPMTLVSEQELSLLSMASVESTHPPDTSDRGTSPSVLSVSSATSSRRLEWDSAADIGYQGANASSTSLSTLERITIGNYASSIALNDPDTQGDYHHSKKKGKYTKTSSYFRKALPEFGLKPDIFDGRRGHKTMLQNRLLLHEESPTASKGNRLKKAKPPSVRACTSDEESQSMGKVNQSPRRRLRKRSSLYNIDKENRKLVQQQCNHAPHHLQEKSLSDRYSQLKKSCSLNELSNVSKATKDNKHSISQLDLACFENQTIRSRTENEISSKNDISVNKSAAGESYETSDLAINTTSGTLVQSSLAVPDSTGNLSDLGKVDSHRKMEDGNGMQSYFEHDGVVNKLQRDHGKVGLHFAKSNSPLNVVSTSHHQLSIVESKHQWDVWNLDHAKKVARDSGSLDGEPVATPGGAALNSSLDQSSFIHDLTQHAFSTPSQQEKQLKPDDITASKSLPETSKEEAVGLDPNHLSSNYSSVELEEFSFHTELGAMDDELPLPESKLFEKVEGCSGSKHLEPFAETGAVGVHKAQENQEVSEKNPEIAVVNKILFNLSMKLGKCLQNLSNKQSDAFSSGQFEKLNSYVKFIGTDSSNSKEIELKQEVAELIVDVVGELSGKHECSALQKLSLQDFMNQTSDLLSTNSFAQSSSSTSKNVDAVQSISVLAGTGTLQGSKRVFSAHQIFDEDCSAHSNDPSLISAPDIINAQNRQSSSVPVATGCSSRTSKEASIIPTTSESERSVTPVGREDVVAYQPPSSGQVYYMAVSAECASQPWSLRSKRGPLTATSATGMQSLPALRTTSRQQEERVLQRGRKTKVAAYQPASGEHPAVNDPHHVPTVTTHSEAVLKKKTISGQAEKTKNEEDKNLSAEEIGMETESMKRNQIEELQVIEVVRQRENKNREAVKKLAEKEVLAAVESATKRVSNTITTQCQHSSKECSDGSFSNQKLMTSISANPVLKPSNGTSTVANIRKHSERIMTRENLSESLRALALEPADDASSQELQSCVFVGASQTRDSTYDTVFDGSDNVIPSHIHAKETKQECLDESPHERGGQVCSSPQQLAPHNATTLSALSLSSLNLGSSCRGYSASVSSMRSSSQHSACSCSPLRSGSTVAPESQFVVVKETNSSEEDVAGLTSKVNCSSSFEGEIVSIMGETGVSNRGGIGGANRRDFANGGRVNSTKGTVCGEGTHNNDGINSTTEEKNLCSDLYQNVQGHLVENLDPFGVPFNEDTSHVSQPSDYAPQASSRSVAETVVEEGVCTSEQDVPGRQSSRQVREGFVAMGNAELNTTFPIENCLVSSRSETSSCWPNAEAVPLSHDNAVSSDFCWPPNSGIPVSRDNGAAQHSRWPEAAPSPIADAAYHPDGGAEGGANDQERQAWSSSCSESAYETIRSKDRRLDEAVASSFEFYCTTSKNARAVGYTSSVDEPVRSAITSKSTTDGRASQRTVLLNLDSDAESTYLPSALPEVANPQTRTHTGGKASTGGKAATD